MDIKPLKPLTIIAESSIKYWFDKTYGNTYCSARIYINLDYSNPIYLPFQSGGVSYCEQLILEELEKLGIDPRASDVFWIRKQEQTLQRYAREWGKANG